ncbi:MAG: ParB/RepB/Spo0J family partition protein [Clostridiales bacterium]|nr:ParB/RepB/Spo0J family partition protein [Clostridiales bacterium]
MEGIRREKARGHELGRIRIREIQDNPYQPRTEFDEGALNGLISSIRENGLITPVTVRRNPSGGYILIAGERRIRALKALGRNWADAVILEADEIESRMISLIENIQREQLNVFEEAEGMKELLRASGITQEALSRKLGKNPSTIANRLRLLRLPADVRKVILDGNLTERHARALLKVEDDPEAQFRLAQRAADKSLTVKKLEALVEKEKENMILRKKKMKTILRDKRMFVNAVKDTVKKLTQAGLDVQFRVLETEEDVSVMVTYIKKQVNSSVGD